MTYLATGLTMNTQEQNETIKLSRTGERPIQFEGRQIAAATDGLQPFKKAKTDSRRWHELRLFEHQDGRYVVAIGFRTGMETESPRDMAIVCQEQADVVYFLSGVGDPRDNTDEHPCDPLECLEGFPDDPRFDQKQRNLEQRVTEDFEQRVTQILDQANFVEEI